jgi:hypothetical protein
MRVLTHSGALLYEMTFIRPQVALFFNHSPDKLIVACKHGIFIVKVSTQSTQPFSAAQWATYYQPSALALSDDDAVLMAGSWNKPYSVCGYDTSSLTRLWIQNTANSVGAVCMLGSLVLVSVYRNPTLVLNHKTGAHIASLQKVDGGIFGLGVIEGLLFIPS